MLRYTRPRIAQTKRRDRQMPRHLVVQLLIYVKNVQHKLLKDKTRQKVWGVAVLFSLYVSGSDRRWAVILVMVWLNSV